MQVSDPVFDPSAVSIRPATADDALQLAMLRYRFRCELGEPNETEAAFVARATEWFQSRLAQASWRGWVAVGAEGEIVGHAFMQLVEKIPNPVVEAEHIAYLTNVYVIPPLRNHGLGARLMQAAIEACRALDVDSAILWPSEQSQSLYRRFGFATPQKVLERSFRAE
ncbi:MAG TPA: GNAT family N-acetyltransferase [Herpetosiphonaceae bacterium]